MTHLQRVGGEPVVTDAMVEAACKTWCLRINRMFRPKHDFVTPKAEVDEAMRICMRDALVSAMGLKP